MKRGVLACAAILTVQAAWAVVPTDYPVQFAVTERHRLTLVASARGRTATSTRRFSNEGTVRLEDATRIYVSGADPGGGVSECVCTHTGKKALRFEFTDASQQEFRDAFESMMSDYGIPGETTVTFNPGRLAFSRSGAKVSGRDVIRVVVKGRYYGVPFRVSGPWVITWKGPRV